MPRVDQVDLLRCNTETALATATATKAQPASMIAERISKPNPPAGETASITSPAGNIPWSQATKNRDAPGRQG